MSPCVYRIFCIPTRESYIGRTVNLKERWWDHRNRLNRGKHSVKRLQVLWDKYGEDAFAFAVVQECGSDTLHATEMDVIRREKPALNPMQVSEDGKWIFPNRIPRAPWSRTSYTPEMAEKVWPKDRREYQSEWMRAYWKRRKAKKGALALRCKVDDLLSSPVPKRAGRAKARKA